jgi:hypothetical protein
LVVVAEISPTITRADERLRAPVLSDEREEPVPDFVPLTGGGPQITDRDVEAEFRWPFRNRTRTLLPPPRWR